VSPDALARLDAQLATRFDLVDHAVSLGDWPVVLRKPRAADALISEADYVRDERLPYWADLWPSAPVLAEHCLRQVGAGRTLLELGCGLGLATLAAMRAGFVVTASDYYDDALLLTRRNALANVGHEPTVRMLDWRGLPDDLPEFDVVMAADVLYERPYGLLVAQVVARLLARDGVAWMADPGRVAREAFREALPSVGLREVASTEYGLPHLMDWEPRGDDPQSIVRRVALIEIRHA
jgi:predicted nicotinamide N-methyase